VATALSSLLGGSLAALLAGMVSSKIAIEATGTTALHAEVVSAVALTASYVIFFGQSRRSDPWAFVLAALLYAVVPGLLAAAPDALRGVAMGALVGTTVRWVNHSDQPGLGILGAILAFGGHAYSELLTAHGSAPELADPALLGLVLGHLLAIVCGGFAATGTLFHRNSTPK